MISLKNAINIEMADIRTDALILYLPDERCVEFIYRKETDEISVGEKNVNAQVLFFRELDVPDMMLVKDFFDSASLSELFCGIKADKPENVTKIEERVLFFDRLRNELGLVSFSKAEEQMREILKFHKTGTINNGCPIIRFSIPGCKGTEAGWASTDFGETDFRIGLIRDINYYKLNGFFHPDHLGFDKTGVYLYGFRTDNTSGGIDYTDEYADVKDCRIPFEDLVEEDRIYFANLTHETLNDPRMQAGLLFKYDGEMSCYYESVQAMRRVFEKCGISFPQKSTVEMALDGWMEEYLQRTVPKKEDRVVEERKKISAFCFTDKEASLASALDNVETWLHCGFQDYNFSPAFCLNENTVEYRVADGENTLYVSQLGGALKYRFEPSASEEKQLLLLQKLFDVLQSSEGFYAFIKDSQRNGFLEDDDVLEDG